MFRSPQVVLLCSDLPATAAFYAGLGFREAFRTPAAPAEPIHIDLELDGYRLGLAAATSAREDHGLDPVDRGQRAAVVLWNDDVRSAHRRLLDGGAPDLGAPHVWLGRLLIAWVADPDGHAVQVVQPLGTVHHIALASDWAAAQRTGSYEISTVGRTLSDEGFVHASFADQVDGVAHRFYGGLSEPLVVLEIDPELLDAAVVVEPGDPTDPSSERFPHVYGPIPVRAVTGVVPLLEWPPQQQPQTAEHHGRQAEAQPEGHPGS